MSREDRDPRTSEQRPESFLVCPSISKPKRSNLERLNITPIEADTATFLIWLANLNATLPNRVETIRLVNPGFAEILDSGRSRVISGDSLRAFGLAFNPVPRSRPITGDRSLYLLGAAPRWEDLLQGLDAPRTITQSIATWVNGAFEREPELSVAVVLGSAGSGKSTIIRRLGIQLTENGRSVFLTNSESLPPPQAVRAFVDSASERVALLLDNAEVALGQLPDLVSALRGCVRPPIIIVAARTNEFDRRAGRLPSSAGFKEFLIPNLDRGEIESLLVVLETRGLLGDLNGKSKADRIRAFEIRAQRQILVAMREATSGKGFDEIIRSEFESLVPEEAKHLYLCAGLATDAGYRLTREEIVGCGHLQPSETLHILNRNLRDVVVPTGPADSLFLLRHRLIAEHVIERCAPKPQLRQAYVRLLLTLAPAIRRSDWRSRNKGLYKQLLNHQTIYRRFRSDIDEARAIFEALIDALAGDAHFWLQFGSLELEGKGGNLALAENYFKQAESLSPDELRIQNALGHLFLRQAREAADADTSVELRDKGSQILEAQIQGSGYQNPYPIHILCYQRYEYGRKWLIGRNDEWRVELDRLLTILNEGCDTNPRHPRLKFLREQVKRAMLLLAVPGSTPPQIPPET